MQLHTFNICRFFFLFCWTVKIKKKIKYIFKEVPEVLAYKKPHPHV